MTFFEEQLIKIFNDTNVDCFDNSCYLNLNEYLYAKIEFVSYVFKPAYDAIKVTIINKRYGYIDSIILKIKDIIGTTCYIEEYHNFEHSIHETKWTHHQPDFNDFELIRNKIQNFINIFKHN